MPKIPSNVRYWAELVCDHVVSVDNTVNEYEKWYCPACRAAVKIRRIRAEGRPR